MSLKASLSAVASASPRNWGTRALLATCALVILVGASMALRTVGFSVAYLAVSRSGRLLGTGFALAAVVVAAVASPAWRMPLLLAVSAAAYPFFIGGKSLLVAAYAVAVCSLARAPLGLGLKVALALLAWAAIPMCRWWVPALKLDGPLPFFMVWVQLAYSAVYLLVEHARGEEKPKLTQSLLYLVALPRLLNPFFQPISPSHMTRSAKPQIDVRTLARGVGLGLYSLLLQVPIAWLNRYQHANVSPALAVAASIAFTYCLYAENIFAAVSLFRLMGFDISSGFRWPFLAESFADFFTRWNSYVRDAVFSLFYVPLFLRFRRTLSPRLSATAAGYVSILVGAYLLNQLLVPVGTSADWRAGLMQELNPVNVAMMLVFWSAIILPSTLLIGSARMVSRPWPRCLRVVRFWVLYGALYAVGAIATVVLQGGGP
jgi:hypothetical protein